MVEQVEKNNGEPSSEWTDNERATAALRIAQECERKLHAAGSGLTQTNEVLDVLERIKFVLSQSPTLLEANRDHILKGQKVV